MQASELRHPVDIQRRMTSGDGYVWGIWKHVMASIEPLSAREFLNVSQNVNPVQAKMKMWWLAGIDPTMRVVHGDVIYNIEAVLEDNQSGRHWMTLMVSRGTNVG
jgi:SPP1 family predicted phage head-tail adaptor